VTLRIAEQVGLSDVGRHRQTNEDSYLTASPVFAVADGMGGARAGEVASKMAVEEFTSASGEGTPEERLARIATSANRRIWEHAQADESRAGMGTTLTSVIVGDGEITIGHVGDSRAYRLRDHELEQLTHDHSLVAELERRGELRHEEAESHPQKNIITRALGPEPDVEVDTHTHSAQPGDVYLLCSDGLTTMVSEDRVADVLRAGGTLSETAQRLVDEANRRGGKDNTTVVLLRLDAGEAGDGDASAGGETLVGDEAEEVREGVAAATAQRTEAPDSGVGALERPRRPAAAPPVRKGGPLRTALRVLVPLLVTAVVVGGLYLGARQVYFLGTSDNGVVTLYRGLPYDLPFGIELYSEDFESSVPASAIPQQRRERVLDHELRSRDDAADLVKALEQERLNR
jgi:protein phosphatase